MGFFKAGHGPTLVAAFLYFDLSFAVWVLLGPQGIYIARDLGFSPAEKGMMVAFPVLAGAILRPVLGSLADRGSPKAIGAAAQALVIVGLVLAWMLGVQGFTEVLLLGGVLGVAGASFAVALPLVSRWYPPQYQGTALGIAGAGNSGTVLASLFAPSLAVSFGWQQVFGWVLVPLVLVLVFFLGCAKNPPGRLEPKTLKEHLRLLGVGDARWFMFFYCVTFGGFIGLTSSLPIYFHDQFQLEGVEAGYYTAACVLAGSAARPVGGVIADRFGGGRSLLAVLVLALIGMGALSTGLLEATLSLALLILTMLALGMGNGSVFQMLPVRFSSEVGLLTGLVGMTGGLGGFFLAAGLGYVKQWTGAYQLGFAAFSLVILAALAGVVSVISRWRRGWAAQAGIIL